MSDESFKGIVATNSFLTDIAIYYYVYFAPEDFTKFLYSSLYIPNN